MFFAEYITGQNYYITIILAVTTTKFNNNRNLIAYVFYIYTNYEFFDDKYILLL